MANESTRRRQEDEMLKYAVVEATVKKHYAIRFNGYPDDLPHFFGRHVYDLRRLPARCDEIEIATREVSRARTTAICKKGDWIVVKHDGSVLVVTDDQFREAYIGLEDLNYE